MTPSSSVFPPMKPLQSICMARSDSFSDPEWGEFQTFLEMVNERIDALNKLINAYNRASISEKPSKLGKIYRAYKSMADEVPAAKITRCPLYRTIIHRTLFRQIKEQADSLRLSSLSALDPSDRSPPDHPGSALAMILEEMDPGKIKELAILLSNHTTSGVMVTPDALNGLYEPTDPMYEGFSAYWGSHAIRCLSAGNSHNFKITGPDGRQFILKLDNSFGLPRVKTAELRGVKSLCETFTPTYAERQTTFRNPSGVLITRTFVITDFCAGGDLESHAAQRVDKRTKISSALDFYSQMAAILLQIKDNKCLHPDMKNSNWLVDGEGRLRIADDKALLPAESGTVWRRTFDYRAILKKSYDLISTRPMNPPEFASKVIETSVLSVGKAHSYMLGKNLYQYLTGCNLDSLSGQHNAESYNFNYSTFRTHEGRQLKTLIEALIKPKASDRMRMKKALETLKSIQFFMFQKTVSEGLEAFCRHQLSDDDRAPALFIEQKIKEINETKELGKLVVLERKLNALLSTLEDDNIVGAIASLRRSTIKSIRPRVNALIDRLSSIPLQERTTSSKEMRSCYEELELLRNHQQDVKTYRAALTAMATFRLDEDLDVAMTEFLVEKRRDIRESALDPRVEIVAIQAFRSTLEPVQQRMQEQLNQLDEIAMTYSKLQPLVDSLRENYYRLPIEERRFESEGWRELQQSYERLNRQAECLALVNQIRADRLPDNDGQMRIYIREARRVTLLSTTDLGEHLTHLQTNKQHLNASKTELDALIAEMDSIAQDYPLLKAQAEAIKRQTYEIPIEERRIGSEALKGVKTGYERLKTQAQCLELIDKMMVDRPNRNDRQMTSYIDEARQATLLSTTDLGEHLTHLQTNKQHLNASKTELDALIAEMDAIAQDYPVLKAQAEAIKRQTYEIPIEERRIGSEALKGVKTGYERLKTQAQCLSLINKLRGYQLDNTDNQMESYIEETTRAILLPTTALNEQLIRVQTNDRDLTNSRSQLFQIITELNTIVQNHPSLQAQTEVIKTQLYAIPIEARVVGSGAMLQLTAALGFLKQRIECHRLLSEIAKHRLSIDPEMDAFVGRKTSEIDQTAAEALPVLRAALEKTLRDQQETIPAIKKIITDFRAGIKCHTFQKGNKARTIEEALCSTPIEVRSKEGLMTSDLAARFREALAARRRFMKLSVYKEADGSLNTKKAAPTYSRFFQPAEPPPTTPTEELGRIPVSPKPKGSS